MRTLTKADKVLTDIEELSESSFLPIIGPVKGKYLADTVSKYKVKRVLEVGTLIGYSAILIAKNMDAKGKVITIEINPDSAEKARRNIRYAGLSDNIVVVVGDALNVIQDIQGTFDMAFIDAAKNEYFGYLKLIEPKLDVNGVVFADNVKMAARQMRDYLDYVRNSGKYRSEFIDVGFDGVEISVRTA